jgi:ribosome-associated protein
VATAVQLKVALGRTHLPEAVKARLRKLAGSQLTHHDEVVIFAHRFRSQLRNKEDALARWLDLLGSARVTPKRRVATRPTRAQRQARLDDKKKHARIKRLRGKKGLLD